VWGEMGSYLRGGVRGEQDRSSKPRCCGRWGGVGWRSWCFKVCAESEGAGGGGTRVFFSSKDPQSYF
jgi:hypothetical protein